jgi:hypothetical protein
MHCNETNKFQPTKKTSAANAACWRGTIKRHGYWLVFSGQKGGRHESRCSPCQVGRLLVQILIFVLEVTDLALCLFLGDPVALLHLARKLVLVTLKFLQVIVSELTPLLLNLALELHPLTGGFIPIHVALLKGMDKRMQGCWNNLSAPAKRKTRPEINGSRNAEAAASLAMDVTRGT